jgi:hypothetical protein
MNDRKVKRIYMNLKLSRNLTDRDIAKKLGITRYKLMEMKKTWGLNLRKQKDNVCGLSEEDFKRGNKIGLTRRRILKRVRDLGWTIEMAITEPLDKTKIHVEWRTKNDK